MTAILPGWVVVSVAVASRIPILHPVLELEAELQAKVAVEQEVAVEVVGTQQASGGHTRGREVFRARIFGIFRNWLFRNILKYFEPEYKPLPGQTSSIFIKNAFLKVQYLSDAVHMAIF